MTELELELYYRVDTLGDIIKKSKILGVTH